MTYSTFWHGLSWGETGETMIHQCRLLCGRPHAILLAALAGACSDRDHGDTQVYLVDPAVAPNRERVYSDIELDAVVIAGSLNDTVIVSPSLLTAYDGKVYVYDWANQRIVRFSDIGVPEAWFGREGGGPQELRMVNDIEVDPANGNLHVLDVGNARITALDANLELLDEISLGSVNAQPQSALPVADGYLLYTIATDSSLVSVTEAGEMRAKRPLPWSELRDVHWMAREGLLVRDPNSDRLVYAFIYGNGWLAFESSQLEAAVKGRYLSDTPFPTVVTIEQGNGLSYRFSSRAVPSIRGASMEGGCLFILANDVGSSSESVIDVFDVRSANYAYSYRVPYRIGRLTISNGIAYALGNDPYPVLVRADIPGGPGCGSNIRIGNSW